MLLVLDNCEHLANACAELAEDLLLACWDLRILATSREPLRVTGEIAWRVPSLAVPEAATSADQLAKHGATQLFVERATAVRHDFQVTAANAPAIAEVCRRLDGIPLALELAATRVRLLSVEQIVRRLDDRFRLLAGGGRTAPRRQQTLRATLDWSYGLLGRRERLLFNRLSVFSGTWSLDAAEAICSGGGIEQSEVLDLLARLADQSLVVLHESAGQMRYRILETVRQYAAEKLEESHEALARRTCHLDWFLAQAEASPFELFDPQHIERLAVDVENLRQALHWSIQSDVESGLRLANATSALWYQRGFYAEGSAWFARLLGLPGAAVPTRVRAFALIRAAFLATIQGDYTVARALNDDGLALSRRLRYSAGMAWALLDRGFIARSSGDLAAAQSLFEEALSISHRDKLSATQVYALHLLGLVAMERGNDGKADSWSSEALALAKQIGHVRVIPSVLNVLGHVAIHRGERADGRAILEQSLALHRENSDRDGIEVTLRALAQVSMHEGRASSATALYAESLELSHQAGDRLEVARCLEGLAEVTLGARPEHAVRLTGAANALRDALGAVPHPGELALTCNMLEQAQRRLGSERYTAAWAAGTALSVDEAVTLALSSNERAGHMRANSSRLSARERDVVRLIAHGCSNRQIAQQLVIAPRTAETHVGHILSKLNLHTRAELAAWAVEQGLLAST
jgi:non-specific serine/threonine protein kinase